ncbi:unnamed protein product [Schistosoma mattheei]|uniref:Uncharacterized protein n=1 Tax=Schistosoma mattheei TaxID=31246 RepID=A0A183NLQ3_9TREM|nr:unnamed protein product [Schistosoma mattheei]
MFKLVQNYMIIVHHPINLLSLNFSHTYLLSFFSHLKVKLFMVCLIVTINLTLNTVMAFVRINHLC